MSETHRPRRTGRSIGAVVMRGVGPTWYPIVLIVLAMPGSWLGGTLDRMTKARQ